MLFMSTTFPQKLLLKNSIQSFFPLLILSQNLFWFNHISTDLFSFNNALYKHIFFIKSNSFNSTAQFTNHFHSTLSIHSYLSFNELCPQISFVLVKLSPYLFSLNPSSLSIVFPDVFSYPKIRQNPFIQPPLFHQNFNYFYIRFFSIQPRIPPSKWSWFTLGTHFWGNVKKHIRIELTMMMCSANNVSSWTKPQRVLYSALGKNFGRESYRVRIIQKTK